MQNFVDDVSETCLAVGSSTAAAKTIRLYILGVL